MYLDDETRPTFRNDFMIKYCDRICNRMRLFDIYDIEDDDEDVDEDEFYEGEEEFDEEDFDFDVMDDEDEFDVDEDDELFEAYMNLEWNQQDDATDYGYGYDDDDDDDDADHDHDNNNNDIQEENNGGILMHGWQTSEDGVLGENTQDEQVIGHEGENNVFDNIQRNRDYYYDNDDDDDDDDDDAYQSDGIDFD